jgi:hypothetical protein
VQKGSEQALMRPARAIVGMTLEAFATYARPKELGIPAKHVRRLSRLISRALHHVKQQANQRRRVFIKRIDFVLWRLLFAADIGLARAKLSMS